MKTLVGVVVRPRSACVAAVVLAMAAGCTPRNIHWMDSDALIQPEMVRVDPQQSPTGYLVVAAQRFDPGDDEVEMYAPIYLYDQSGKFVVKLPNNSENPMPVRPGDYIVLVGEQMDPAGEFHQVQVRVVEGETTTVSQADIDHAPEFWALSRDLSR